MKKLSALLMTLTLALALCACGGGDTASDPNLGRYDADQINIMGWSDFSSLFEGENYLELKANGKGSVKLAGESGSLKWTLDGENITITIEGVDSSGTLKDGVITLDDLFNMGCAATFVKEGATASSTDSNDSGSDSSTADDAATGGTAKLESYGVTLTYPTDTFTYEDRISEKIVANDESVEISMNAYSEDDDYQFQLDKYNGTDEESFSDFKAQETTVAGYDATLFTFYYESMGKWEAHWVIDLGGDNASGQTCLVVNAYSETDLASCTSDTVTAILDTLSFS